MNEEIRTKIQTVELSAFELLWYPFKFFWKEIGYGLLAYSFFFFPSFLVYNLIDLSVFTSAGAPPKSIMANLLLVALYLILWLTALCFSPLLPLWATVIIQEKIAFGTVSYRQALDRSFARYFPLAWTLIWQLLILAGLFLLFIIPGIIWTIYYFFSTHVVAITPLEQRPALEYSKSLVKGRWWIIFFTFLFIQIVISIGSFILSIALFSVPLTFLPHNVLLNSLNSLVSQLGFPCAIFCFALWFVNLHFLREREKTFVNSVTNDQSTN